ncbi:Rieske (2Fe-2S) protein [Phycicoccus sp. SLBN-51]|jgi:Rieske Fe-S protein|uniref:Rieske (2Fe-2S) protein n=1 Tax=Phycicoccus sp. SLBN-51 TaxID=2768447 RepID=UPI001153B783|nr:Rieske (2Fe-2S) protein [Phycicoccus sp. SLBN-51]TQJ50962.1 Rieske Fe-S protein [Phycicoccus sp. SLBN-51]
MSDCCSRRALLQSAGVVGGALALSACGAAENTARDAASSAGAAASSALKDAVSKATVPVGGGKVLADQKVVITQPTEGDFKAFTAVCTHQGCIVADVSGGTINCACHGSKFDIATGDVKQGPATQPLPRKTVSVTTDGIKVS